MFRAICLFMLIGFSSLAFAKENIELQQLHSLLNRINQEQQSVYQRFQMVLELRRINSRSQDSIGAARLSTSELISYDEATRAKEDAVRRESELTNELDRLYARFNELEESKRPILDRLNELVVAGNSQSTTATLPAPTSVEPRALSY